MVYYYVPLKRAAKKPKTSDKSPPTDLPTEALLLLAGHVAISDILKFRLACSTLAAVGTSTLQDPIGSLEYPLQGQVFEGRSRHLWTPFAQSGY